MSLEQKDTDEGQKKITAFMKFPDGFKGILGEELTGDFFKKLRHTITDEGEAFLDRVEEGKPLCITLLEKCIGELPLFSPHLNIFSKLSLKSRFYDQQSGSGDALDVCCAFNRHDILFTLLTKMGRKQFEARLSGDRVIRIISLFTVNVVSLKTRTRAIECLQRFINFGLDPDTPLEKAGGLGFEGDTVLSILLQHSCTPSTREFVELVFQRHIVDMERILTPYKYSGERMSYLSLALITGPTRHVDNLTARIFSRTPMHTILSQRDSATNPVNIILQMIKTPWDGYMLMCPPSITMLMELITRGAVLLDEDIVWNLHLNESFTQTLRDTLPEIFLRESRPLYLNLLKYQEGRGDPAHTGLVAFANPPTMESLNHSREGVVARILEICEERPTPPVNETFLNCDEVDGCGVFTFWAEDNYVFSPDEWEFLSTSGTNPYTRRRLTEREVYRLDVLIRLMRENWLLFSEEENPYVSKMFRAVRTLRGTVDTYVQKIDEIMDACGLIPYGSRMKNIRQKLAGDGLNLFVSFIHNPLPYILLNNYTDLSSNCIPFSTQVLSTPVQEEIHIYYLSLLERMRSRECSDDYTLTQMLGFVYMILSTSGEDQSGRILTVYHAIEFIETNWV